MKFIYSWRWFGPNDRVTLNEISQTGADGIVTALHQVPVGEVWTKEAIHERKSEIENAGLKWVVVESLPVSEDIKKKSGSYLQHIENYKTSIQNLAECGIKTICYNFMPILDWSRTNLKWSFDDGSFTSGFQIEIFAAFDLFILQRKNASKDYSEDLIQRAEAIFNKLDAEEKKELQNTILYGLPGSLEAYTLEEFRGMLNTYSEIDREVLKDHLKFFLNEVVPVAEKNGLKLAVHPDDPPWNLLGLPRIVSTIDDLKDIIQMVDSPSNGVTLCSGSLGAGHFNDIASIVRQIGPSINFLHLRNVIRDEGLNFREDHFFNGQIDMVDVVKEIIAEGKRRAETSGEVWEIPIRPDHGHQILGDIGLDGYYPGYSLYGRMKNLAEIKGLTTGLLRVAFND